MDIDYIKHLLQSSNPYTNEVLSYDSKDFYPNMEISEREILRRRGFFSRYDNIIINHFEHPYDCFELHIKALDTIGGSYYDHSIHLIENKDLDKVVDHIKADKSLGKYNFQAGPPYDPANCLAHKDYTEYTKKEKSQLIKSHGSEYVHKDENKIKIDYDLRLDDDNIEMIKDFDGRGNVTIRLCRWYDKFDDIVDSGIFYSFSKRSAEALGVQEACMDPLNDWDYREHLKENPGDRFASGEMRLTHSLFGIATKEEILDLGYNKERQRTAIMYGAKLKPGEIFSITFDSKRRPICMSKEGTGYVFIDEDGSGFNLIRKTTNYVQEANFAIDTPLINTDGYQQNIIEAKNLCYDLGWI